MKMIVLFIFLGFIVAEEPELGDGRLLNESIKLIFEDSVHEETKDMWTFYQQIIEEHDKNSETIKITSSMNSDNSQTTGNEDNVDDIQLLLPTYEIPIQDKEISLKAKEHLL